jgi:hypothetical protein
MSPAISATEIRDPRAIQTVCSCTIDRLSNRIFKSFDDIVDQCCYVWNTLIDQPWKIMSIAHRDWASVGHST